MTYINPVTVLIIAVFVLPILLAALRGLSREKLHYSITGLFSNIEALIALLLAIYITKRIFFENDDMVFGTIYSMIPEDFKNTFNGKDILIYIMVVPIIFLVLSILFRLVTNPLYNFLILPLTESIHMFYQRRSRAGRSIISALWQVPKSLFMVLVAVIILNFYTYYYPSQQFSGWMNRSTAYQFVYGNAVYPFLNSSLAKKVPVLVNDSFRQIGLDIIGGDGKGLPDHPGRVQGNIGVIEYFNGVTLDEAVKSNKQIDSLAVKIAGKEKNSKSAARALYAWVSKNISYDDEKAEKVSKSPRGTESGAIVAFNTRKGICFDYSCLYIAMCRAAGLKVRLVTGLAYSGVSWGDHAWNQVFIKEENRWINVDTTFGSSSNYFDKKDFDVDHRYAQVHGEW